MPSGGSGGLCSCPYKPNKKAIGFNILTDSLQKVGASAIQNRSLIFAGPLNLVQRSLQVGDPCFSNGMVNGSGVPDRHSAFDADQVLAADHCCQNFSYKLHARTETGQIQIFQNKDAVLMILWQSGGSPEWGMDMKSPRPMVGGPWTRQYRLCSAPAPLLGGAFVWFLAHQPRG
jgi:CHASE1-domain containing sensor protein